MIVVGQLGQIPALFHKADYLQASSFPALYLSSVPYKIRGTPALGPEI